MTTDIWWPSLCGNRTNYDAFWSYDLTLNTDNPDLSVCLQDTILTWVPCGTLFLLSPINIYHLLKQPKQHSWKAFSKINLVKTFAIICLIITSVLALIEGINTTINQTQARLIALILRLITYVTVAIFIRWEYVKGKHTSGVLFLFWLLQVICDIIPFRSLIIRKQIDVEVPEYKQFVLFYISYGLIIIEIITHSISDVKAFGSSNPIRTIQLSEEKIPLIDKNVLRDNPNAQNPIPEMYVPIWQKVTFWWIIPDIFKGYRKPVQMDDLYDLRKEDSCKVLLRHFEQYYRGYVSPKKKYLGSTANYSESHREHNTGQIKKSWQFSFFWSIFLGAGWPATLGTVLQTVCVLCQALYPQILRLLISFIEGGDEDTWKGCMLAFCMLILSFSISILRQNNMYLGYSAGLKVRSVVNSIIYRKAIRLTSAAKKTTTVGEIVNLMAVDSQKLQDVFTFSFLLYQVPLLVVVSTYLIWDTVGNSAFAGLGMLLIILPLNSGYLASKIRKLQNKQMNSKDERIKSMNEILSGIKILKLYAWEPSFQQHLISVREKELVTLKKANILNAISGVFMFLAPYLVSLAIFGVFVLTSSNNILDPDKAFVTLAYINLFNYSLSYLPLSVNYAGQSVVSVQRITKFLDMDELNEDYVEINDQMKDAVCIQEGSFSWKEKDKSILQDVTMRVTRGKLVAVVGQVGSGKSSLLSALLGEMVKSEGTVAINGSVAYVPQQAWIQNATLQNNILFGKPHVNARYDKILKACALKPDLKVLPCGDQTEIGEKGINLSGGQKQRVSLARAMYQDEDIYLLDDPLSAVDAHVGKQLFENVIGPDGMLNHKTRILVTHGITYLPFVDEIFLLRGGVVLESGRYQELLHKQGAFTEFIKNCRIDDEKISYDSDIDTTLVGSPISSVTGSESDTERTRPTPLRRKYRKTISSQSSRESQISIKETQGQEKLIEEELSQVGAIKLSVIWTFVKAGGLVFFVLVVFFQVVFTFTQVVTNIWLSAWTNDVPVNGTSSSTSLWLGVYAGLGVAQAAAILIVLTASAYGCVTASRFLHKQLLETILHAPMVFFDTTPLGRIMNRFSRDIDVIDTQLPILLRSWLFCVSPLVASVVIITYSTPIFLVVLFPLGFIYIMSQRMYIVYAGQLKRYDSVLRSPIYAHFDESITGASSIRAYRRQQEFMDRCDYLIDESQKPYYLLCIAQRCLGILMEFLGGVLIFFATLFAVLQRDSLSSGLVALSVTFALEITNNLIGMVRRSTELETYMVSVERIDEYCKVKPEAPWKIPGEVYPFGWPCKGEIIFKDYATRYRPGLGLVLNNISLTVHPGEKVGVVGRTGAGKSSLSLALFRIIEASSGNITIDGVNIARIGLHDIRARVTIIPQDPVIFSGSLRLNLDPFARYSDDEIWSALQHAHLKPFVTSLREGLDYQCGEGGESLSVGQRQLVCLARALLRKSKILVMDEATAAVDLETDALIQITIKKQFEACTVLTVAHRLNTVMDYDRILVLDKGVIKEFDTPNVLMADKHSLFYGLAKEAGLT